MKRLWILLPFFLAGCSTAPIADALDFFAPGRIPAGTQLQQSGGVCLPQGGAPGSALVTPNVQPPGIPPNGGTPIAPRPEGGTPVPFPPGQTLPDQPPGPPVGSNVKRTSGDMTPVAFPQ